MRKVIFGAGVYRNLYRGCDAVISFLVLCKPLEVAQIVQDITCQVLLNGEGHPEVLLNTS